MSGSIPVLKEVWRRFRNFWIGPRPALLLFKRAEQPKDLKTNERRHIYVLPWPALLRWYADPGLHFDKLGLIEVDWLVWTAGIYWVDQN